MLSTNEFEELEEKLQQSSKSKQDESEDEDCNDEVIDALNEDDDVMKRAAVLLEFIADPALCRALSKRERELASRLADQLWSRSEEVQELIGELEDE
jgi:hypothetical protein